MKKLTQKEINGIVWKACDTFRGTIDATQYKDYILTMLFLKYVTDVWKDKKAFTKDMKLIYDAPTKQAARAALEDFASRPEEDLPPVIPAMHQ